MQHRGRRPELCCDLSDSRPDRDRVGHVRTDVVDGHAGRTHPGQVAGQLGVDGWVGPPEQRQPGSGVNGQRERALGGYPLATAGH